VEKPFLESPAILMLRFDQELQSKRGIIPPAEGLLLPDFPALVRRYSTGPFGASVWLSPEAISSLFAKDEGALVFPTEAPLPTGALLSRFLAKAGLEAMALRLVSFPDGLDYLAGEAQLDLVRRHARFGEPSEWPIHARRIYDAQRKWIDQSGEATQVIFEFDILVTEAKEYYFVLALFGLELAINLGGPEIVGYTNWLKHHGEDSPLYSGHNIHSTSLIPAT
jgi:hypothetical protein